MRLQDVTSEAPKIAAALRAEFLHRVRAEHSVAFELRLGEELVSGGLVREGDAPLKIFVDVTRANGRICYSAVAGSIAPDGSIGYIKPTC